MMLKTNSSHRILFNTIAMYLKTIIAVFVGLFSTRYVLEALGIDDFGISALVGSVIGLLGFLNSSMAEATQRFLSYHRTKNDINSVFTTSVIIHFIIGIFFVVMLEIGGLLFLDTLNINVERKYMAHIVFHCMVASTFFSVISTPYTALINAKEDMFFSAFISILESFLKLAIAFCLFHIPFDRLGTYAFSMMCLRILLRIIQRVLCKIRYPKIGFSHKSIDKSLIFKMLSFSSWNVFDSICYIFKTQGLSILLNMFFGTALNAVLGMANQVRTQVATISTSLSQASAPRIVSGISEQNVKQAMTLAISTCKFAFLLVSLLGIPLILNIDYVLSVWLKKVPVYLPIFCCLALANEMIKNLTRGLYHLIIGKGFIRGYKIAIGLAELITFPIAYILLKMNYHPYSIYVGLITSDILIFISRLYFAHRHVNLNVPHYLKEISKVLVTVITAFLCIWATMPLVTSHSPLATLIITTTLSSALMLTGFWLALDPKEREFAKGLWKKFIS